MSRRPSAGHLFPGAKRLKDVAGKPHFKRRERKPRPAAYEEHRA